MKIRGILYNSKKALCSIHESGKMCYDSLSKSSLFTLDYSEEQTEIDNSYDFIIINHHPSVNCWVNEIMIQTFNKPTFCIVTEVGLNGNPIPSSPIYFSYYIVLDPTINETTNIFAFGRPLEDIDFLQNDDLTNENDIPKIGSFGFATQGKELHKIVQLVNNEFDYAEINLNFPVGHYVPQHNDTMNDFYNKCRLINIKPGIKLNVTHNNLSKQEIVEFCRKNTINCFLYNRNGSGILGTGLAAVTDQAIVSEKPLLVSCDPTFRHIHKYIDYYPNTNIKEAIKNSKEGVIKMKNDWCSKNFLNKFENILYSKNIIT